jgi:hypothetical protein
VNPRSDDGSALNKAIIRERYVRILACLVITGLVAYGFFFIRDQSRQIISLQRSLHTYVSIQTKGLQQQQRGYHRNVRRGQRHLDRIVAREFHKLFIGIETGRTPSFVIKKARAIEATERSTGHKHQPKHHHKGGHPKPSPSPTPSPICVGLTGLLNPKCMVHK